jgi:hypothetical protein
VKRPTYKELSGKLKNGKEALTEKSGLFADPSKAVSELMELNILETEKVWPLICELLEEISPDDYTGGKPPQKSYEPAIEGSELFAFTWNSIKLSKMMYLKFVLKDETFYYVSLHEDRPILNNNGGE